MSKYDFDTIETEVQQRWRDRDEFRCDNDAEPSYYVLGMFPYPSGDPHMGHVRVYTITDVVARHQRLRGFRVIHPLGWDSFGLPAENAAIKHEKDPREWTAYNIERMRDQLARMGWSFDMAREINTASPDYYRWMQWIFLKFLEHGKAFRDKSRVNWCPTCATVLANEQVIDGSCWRCDAEVEQRLMEQWFLRTTDYAEDLWRDLSKLGKWTPRATAVQRRWINKSQGANIDFPVEGKDEKLIVYTTRADTLFGATALVIAPEHALTSWILEVSPNRPALEAYIAKSKLKRTRERLLSKEKTGVATGTYVRHPLADKKIEIWLGDYVIADYGSGAVMCVPAHDTRDHQFAVTFDLDIVEVVAPPEGTASEEDAFTDDGVLINSGEFDGLSSAEARERIAEKLANLDLGRPTHAFNLRDWSVGRQRYWGCPIPIIDCQTCGPVGVPESDLPVRLAEDVQFDQGKAQIPEDSPFRDTTCPSCGGPAKRETDTLDTFMDSAWYAFRFIDPNNAERVFDSAAVNKWMPIDFYVGGLEHAAQHMIYFRFFTKFFREIGLIDFDEPVDEFFCNGMVTKDGHKMSKSLGNVVTPAEMLGKYGADALRLYILSNSPAEDELPWTTEGLQSKLEFLGKNFAVLSQFLDDHYDADYGSRTLESFSRPAVLHQFYKTLSDLKGYLDRRGFHGAIARLHELSNTLLSCVRTLRDPSADDRKVVSFLIHEYLVVCGLFVPHFAEWLLAKYYRSDVSVYHSSWPAIEEQYVRTDEVVCVVQINGKKRAQLDIPRDSEQAAVEAMALELAGVTKYTEGKSIAKIIYVPNRLLNIVVR